MRSGTEWYRHATIVEQSSKSYLVAENGNIRRNSNIFVFVCNPRRRPQCAHTSDWLLTSLRTDRLHRSPRQSAGAHLNTSSLVIKQMQQMPTVKNVYRSNCKQVLTWAWKATCGQSRSTFIHVRAHLGQSQIGLSGRQSYITDRDIVKLCYACGFINLCPEFEC